MRVLRCARSAGVVWLFALQIGHSLMNGDSAMNVSLQVVQVLNIGICCVLPLLMMDAAAGIADSFLCQLCAVLAVPVLVHPPGVTAAKFVINGGAVNPQSFRDTLHADPIEVIFFQLPTILNRQMSAAQSSLIPLVA